MTPAPSLPAVCRRLSTPFAAALLAGLILLPLAASAQTWSSAGRTDHAAGGGLEWVSMWDLNNDGHKDLVTANYLTNNVSVLINNGVGGFTRTDYAAGSGPYTAIVTDLNNDIQADLLVANSAGGTISVLLGDGSGSFLSQVQYASGPGTAVAATGDFNLDGNRDVVTVNYWSSTMSIFLGDGSGSFAPRVDYPTGLNPNWVAIGDVTGDGISDAVVCNFTDSDVSVFPGTGGGTFGSRTDYPCGANPLTLTLDYLNGDSFRDIATANYGAGTTSVLMANGFGGFGPKTDFPTGPAAVTVHSGDVNVDGKVDLAVTSESGDLISLLMGNGTGTFAPTVDYAVGDTPYGVVFGDVTGDGRPDIVTANYGSNNVTVLAGSLPGGFRVNAPAAQLTALNQNGASFSLSSTLGKWTVLDFCSVWCGPCNQLATHTEQVYQTWVGHPTVQFEYVTCLVDGRQAGKTASQTDATNWANRYAITRPVLHGAAFQRAGTRAWWDAVGTNLSPTLVFIDPTGVIRAIDPGAPDAQGLVDRIAQLAGVPSPPLAGKTPPPPPPPAIVARPVFQAVQSMSLEISYGEVSGTFPLGLVEDVGGSYRRFHADPSGVPGMPDLAWLDVKASVDSTNATETLEIFIGTYNPEHTMPVAEPWKVTVKNMTWPDGQARITVPQVTPLVSAVYWDGEVDRWLQTPIQPAMTGMPLELEFTPFAIGNTPELPDPVNGFVVSGVQLRHVGTVSVMTPTGEARLALAPARPNPATGHTSLRWTMPAKGEASLRLVDAAGRVVRRLHSGVALAGDHVSPWDLRNDDGERVAPGIYFAVLDAASRSRSTRVVVLQ